MALNKINVKYEEIINGMLDKMIESGKYTYGCYKVMYYTENEVALKPVGETYYLLVDKFHFALKCLHYLVDYFRGR